MGTNPIVSIRLCYNEASEKLSVMVKRYHDKIHLEIFSYTVTCNEFHELLRLIYNARILSSLTPLSKFLRDIDGLSDFWEKCHSYSISILGKEPYCQFYIRFCLSSRQIGSITRRINKLERKRCV